MLTTCTDAQTNANAVLKHEFKKKTYFKHIGCMYGYLKKSECPEYKGWAKRSLFESGILVPSISF